MRIAGEEEAIEHAEGDGTQNAADISTSEEGNPGTLSEERKREEEAGREGGDEPGRVTGRTCGKDGRLCAKPVRAKIRIPSESECYIGRNAA